MTGVFGHRWVSSYGAMPSETWLAGLIDLEPEQLRTGLVACLDWQGDWPPTLPQFRALCRPRVHEAHKIFQRLPEPEGSRERRKASGMAHLAAMKEEGRYRDWLRQNAGRIEADFDMMLRSLHAMRMA